MFPYRTIIEWSEEDERFIARAPAFEALAADGATQEEAARELAIAGAAMIEVMKETGRAVPPPDARTADYGGKIALRLPRSMHARLSAEAEAEAVSVNQLLVSFISEGMGRRATAK